MLTTDVLVVGAGPAGTAAAISLARRGRGVVVIDKASFPRDKCCGDGLTTDALRHLETLGMRPSMVDNWNSVTDVIVRGPDGHETHLPLPDAGQYAVVVPRADLDSRLVDLARSAGATVLESTTFNELRMEADRVVVTTSDDEVIQARYVVAADGMWSPVRKSLGLNPDGYRGEWHAFRQYFSNVGPSAQHLWVWFEPDLLPGYAWSFPLPGQRANVGFGIARDGTRRIQDMAALWDDLLDRPHVKAVLGPEAAPEGRHKAWPIPARVDEMPQVHGRVVFVGDAVAATDPMTGEGIAQALQTGIAVADAIARGGALRPALVGKLYQRSLDDHLVTDHRFARLLGTALVSPRRTRAALKIATLTPWTRRNFARWMFEDYPRAIVLTPGRWRRGVFSSPGAYREAAEAPDTTFDAVGTAS